MHSNFCILSIKSEKIAQDAFSNSSSGSNLPSIQLKKSIFQNKINIIDLVIMSKFEKDMIDMRRTEGIERTKKLHPERYSGRKIGTKDSPKKFLQKPKSISILKDLDNGYGIREISKMRDCSFNTIYNGILFH